MRFTDRASTLLAPVRGPLDDALRALALPDGGEVSVGAVEGFYAVSDQGIVLSEALEGPGLHHPDEVEGPRGLDRWRRAMACVLEGVVCMSLPPGGPTWLRTGLAMTLADRAAPELGVVVAGLSRASGGDLGAEPRAGVAVLAAWDAEGRDGVAMARHALAADRVEVADWLRAGAWVCGAGWSLRCPDLPRPAPRDVPCLLAPWSWSRLSVQAHPRGAHIRVRGRGGVAPAWARGGEAYTGLAGACEDGARLEVEPGGPVGAWSLRSAVGFGSAFGARGLTFDFRAGGAIDIILADAFVGSMADVAQAERVGTSGMVRGRWRVVGPRTLELSDLTPVGVTVHGRDDAPFVMPAQGMGLPAQLQAMQQASWRWHVDGDAMEMSGEMFGGKVTMRTVRG